MVGETQIENFQERPAMRFATKREALVKFDLCISQGSFTKCGAREIRRLAAHKGAPRMGRTLLFVVSGRSAGGDRFRDTYICSEPIPPDV